jgi:cytochrome oxidase Cu insertion factor (SCO1/SenC/PrrC family)
VNALLLKIEGIAMKSTLGLAAAVAFSLMLSAEASASAIREEPAPLVGTVLPHPAPALDFTLTDQNGAAFRMADTRGRVVVVTFIYTHCGDTCPFMAVKAREARALLGGDASRVDFVAVTTDPKRDTVPVVAAYSRALGLSEGWHFLTGSPHAVRAVWSDYGVGAEVEKEAGPGDRAWQETEPDPEADNPKHGLSPGGLALADGIARQFGGGYEVAHTTPFLVIDPKGMIRIVVDASATPADLATDIRAMMK